MLELIVIHHIADVAFQPSWLIKNKHIHWWSVYEHSVVWAGLISFFAGFEHFFFLLIGHFLIDYIKYRKCKNWNWIYLDQALHYLQIWLVS